MSVTSGDTIKTGSNRKIRITQFLVKYGVVITFAILFLVFTNMADNFLNVKNITNIFRQSSMLMIISLGMISVLMVNGIDLSIGGMVSICGLTAFYTTVDLGYGLFAGAVITLLLGIAFGLWNGIIVTYGKVLPLIATLATSFIIQSIEFIATNGGFPIMAFNIQKSFHFVGNGYIGIIPSQVLIALIMATLFFILCFTVLLSAGISIQSG